METAYIFGVMCFAAFLQTITSFGFALAAAPLLLFVMNPKEVVMFILVAGLINKFFIVHRTWHVGSFRAIILMAAASIPGALAGSYALQIANDAMIKAFIGVVLIFATAAMVKNVAITFQNQKIAQSVVGAISGFLGSTTSFSGPPVMMYLLNEQGEKEAVRANISRYFILGNLVSLLSAYLFGTFHPSEMLGNLLVALPAIWLGFFAGDKLFDRLDASLFRKMAIGVIGLSGLISVGSGLLSYLPWFVDTLNKLH